MLWCAVAVIIAPLIQQAMRELVLRTRSEATVSRELGAVLRGASSTSIIAADREGRVTSFSRGAELMLGYRAEEVVGTADLLAFHDPVQIQEAAAELGVPAGFAALVALTQSSPAGRTVSYVHRDGTRQFVHESLTPVRDETGECTGYVCVAVDNHEATLSRA